MILTSFCFVVVRIQTQTKIERGTITKETIKDANQTYLRTAAALALRQYPPRRRPFMHTIVVFLAALSEPHDAVGEASPCEA